MIRGRRCVEKVLNDFADNIPISLLKGTAMSIQALYQITFLITLAGCCATHSIDVETFSGGSLAEQIREFERARRE